MLRKLPRKLQRPLGFTMLARYLAVDVAYLVEFGASHATSLAAAAASISSIRILRRGLLANLLAVEGNPLDDISCLGRIKLVAEGKMSTFLS